MAGVVVVEVFCFGGRKCGEQASMDFCGREYVAGLVKATYKKYHASLLAVAILNCLLI